MIRAFVFSKPEFKTPDDCHGKLIWKGNIEVLPPVGYEIAVNGILHPIEHASYDIENRQVEIHLDFKDVHNQHERLEF